MDSILFYYKEERVMTGVPWQPGFISSSVNVHSSASVPHRHLSKGDVLPISAPHGHFRLRTERTERELEMPRLTHPDFAKLPRPKFPNQPERLPGDFPLILGPQVLGGWVHTGQGQPLTQTIPFFCFREEKRVRRSLGQTSLRNPAVPQLCSSLPLWRAGFDALDLQCP